jgi:hypothetical protein
LLSSEITLESFTVDGILGILGDKNSKGVDDGVDSELVEADIGNVE